MNRLRRFLERAQLAIIFACVVFIFMALSVLILAAGILLLRRAGISELPILRQIPFLIPLVLASLAVGAILAGCFSRAPLAPIRELIRAMDNITDGDYSVRLPVRGPEEFRVLRKRFNTMAEELGSVEMLRNDFVNNFSHEFKTPIVSIHGFAKMLKRDDLTPEERDEYLDIIIQESQRLADLSTNVLNLSNIEKQTILTDKSQFNVSEQIRLVIALLDSKWSNKQITVQFDCDEISVLANEDLLRQVWINLLDNAIKFSPDRGTVNIDVHQEPEAVVISVANQCPPIPPQSVPHVFDKFYQADTSHTTQGNGLGLTIAQRIVQLHEGTLSLKSSDEEWTVFEVRLPVKNESLK